MEKERQCLKCNKKFLSMSKGNRICQKCKGSSANCASPLVPAALRNRLKKRVRARVGGDHWQGNDDILAPPRRG
jgi:hypothetical protein